MTYDLSTFGEGQLRLTVPAGSRLSDMSTVAVCAAGSEANVAAILSQLGRSSAWASMVPQGSLGDRVLTEYRAAGVDLTHVTRPSSGRVALYYLEPAAGGLPARVVYDRLETPIRQARADDFDWNALLDTRCLFVTGITAALTPETAELVRFAVEAAHAENVPVALDVNHRATLWSEPAAEEVLAPLLEKVWTLFCSRRDANSVFRIAGDAPTVAEELSKRSSAMHVITTDGAAAVHYSGAQGSRSVSVDPLQIRDRPGAGDALVGGTLHGLLDGDVDRALRWGIRAAALALTHDGDLTRISSLDLDAAIGDDIHR